MNESLYDQLIKIESTKKFLATAGNPELLDRIIANSMREKMRDYEKNPVFYYAINNNQSIEDTTLELSKHIRGVRSLLPKRKNKVHNERVEYLKELVGNYQNLKTGLWHYRYLPSILGATIGVGGIVYFVNNPLPIKGAQIFVLAASTFSSIVALSTSFASVEVPIKEAKYLDEKINELYK